MEIAAGRVTVDQRRTAPRQTGLNRSTSTDICLQRRDARFFFRERPPVAFGCAADLALRHTAAGSLRYGLL